MVMLQGVDFDVDYVGRLATNPAGGPTELINLVNKQGIVIHYAGGAQNRSLGLLALMQSYARWHIRPNGFGSGFTGNGLMYHSGIGDEGLAARTQDLRRTRWHAGSGLHNRFYIALNLPIGGPQDATYAQKVRLDELCHSLIRAGVGQDVRTIVGHLEAAPGTTPCPGLLMGSFVRPIRAGTRWAREEDIVVPEADHLIVTVPGVGKFWIIQEIYRRYAMVEEPLFLFGYPLEGMKGNPPYQNFERARLHVEPGSWPERHNVQIAHVGAELARKRKLEEHPAFDPISDPGDRTARYFPETQHLIYGRWKGFWEDFGGLEYFGYPISEVFNDPDSGLDVQYFERARFEHHKHSDWHSVYHGIGLGRVNAELLGVD